MSACCFTGHRTIPRDHIEYLRGSIRSLVLQLAKKGVEEFRCGGAIGFDTLAALTVLECKEQNPRITLKLILPCKDQDKNWTASQKRIYAEILEAADETQVLAEHYYKGCMFVRNQALVDGCEECIAYLTRPAGGTKFTVDYAKKKGVKTINLGEMI